MLDHLPWGAPPAERLSLATHALPEQVVDAQRCTVQFDSGFLYLDALATPATALLGHDRPAGGSRDRAALAIRLSGFDPEYRCTALTASAELARQLVEEQVSELGPVRIADASIDEPPSADEITVAVENESLGRSGCWLASSAWRRKPDVIVIGESLAAGTPFGAILSATRLGDRASSGCARAAPPDATVALAAAVIATVEERQLIEQGRHLARYFRERLEAVRAWCSEIVALDIIGLTARLGFVPGLPAARVKKNLCERGVLVGVDACGRLVIRPPLAMRPAEIDVISGSLRAALQGAPTLRMSACCPSCQMMVE